MIRSLHDQFQDDIRDDCAVSACYALTLFIKVHTPWLLVGVCVWELSLGQMSALPPRLPASKYSKLSFSPTWLLHWCLSSEQPGPTFITILISVWGDIQSIYTKYISLPQVSLDPIRETKFTLKGKEKYTQIYLFITQWLFVEHSMPGAILGIGSTAVDTVLALMQISF